MNSFVISLIFWSFWVASVTSFQFQTTRKLNLISSLKQNGNIQKFSLSAAVKGSKTEPPNDYWQGDWV